MSSLKRKLEGETEIRATAGDLLHQMMNCKPHNVSNAASHFVQGVDLHEGDDHGIIGSISVWKYSLGGKPLVAKCVLEEINEEKKYCKYRIIEGDMMNEYKSFIGTCQMIPKDTETCVAKWIFEYEKMHAGIPEPSALLDSWLEAAKLIDDHHHGIKKELNNPTSTPFAP